MTHDLAYMAAPHPPDLTTARRLCADALHTGDNVAGIVDNMLAPAQVEVGRRWHANEWTIAQEHAATAVTDAVLAEIALRTLGPPTQPGRVVTGCAEGEWHTLPVRMLNLGLGAAGYDVVTLGPSLPSAQLGGFLADLDPIALLLNCTMPTNLAGARRTIEASHSAGVPVIAGGRAFGANGTRAHAIGTDAWANHPDDALSYLHSWTVHRPLPPETPLLNPEQVELEYPTPGLIDDCFQQLIDEAPRLGAMTDIQQARTREDITYILQFCSAAILTDDQTVLAEFTDWLIELLAPRQVPAAVIKTSYQAIARVLGGGYPATVSMLAARTDRL